MAQLNYRANLSAAIFPMLMSKAGRSVMIPQGDQNYDKRIDPVGESVGSVGIPQILYGENFLPTPEGVQSVGFKPYDTVAVPSSGTILSSNVVTIPTVSEVLEEGSGGTPGNTLFSDDCSSLNSWIRSPSAWGSGFGEPPVQFYHSQIRVNSGAFEIMSAQGDLTAANYLYKNTGIVPSQDYEITLDFRFKDAVFLSGASAGQKTLYVSLLNASDGDGIGVVWDSTTASFSLMEDTKNHWAQTFISLPLPIVRASDTLSSDLAYDTWYKLKINVQVNGDGTRTVTADLMTDTLTVLSSINYTFAATVPSGSYLGFKSNNTVLNPGANQIDIQQPFSVFVDNILISSQATDPIPGTVVSKLSGFKNILISFFSDNTVSWGLLDSTYDDNPSATPLGFESPAFRSNVSFASVRGNLYCCIRNNGNTKLYSVTLSGVTLLFTDISVIVESSFPTPYNIQDILGITGSYNYLILHTATTILWSSTTTPTDFAPSLVSGSGNEIPGNLKGDITFCKEHVSGFFIYSSKNVVFAAYTGNQRYPWKFREVSGSGGYLYSYQSSGDTNSASQIGVAINGAIQEISPDSSTGIAPEISTFFERAGGYDTFDTATNVFSFSLGGLREIADSSTKEFPIYFFLDRYVLAPYGVNVAGDPDYTYNYVLVYDLLLKRYGKLKVKFSFIVSNEKEIFFIDRTTGTIRSLDFDIHSQYNTDGVVVLGKFQYVRSRFIQLEELEFESALSTSIQPARDFQVAFLPTLDGKNFITPVELTPNASSTGELVKYSLHKTAHNFCVAIKGVFDLNTVQMTFVPAGDR